MTNANFSINAVNQQNTNQIAPIFVQEENGDYLIKKPLNKAEIIDFAKSLITSQFSKGEKIDNIDLCKDYFLFNLAKYEHEVFCAIFLDNQNRIIAFEHLFSGTINQAVVYPREVVKKALKYNASAIIFAHNHTSSSTTPSPADKTITARLKEILAILEVRVLDHIIVAGNQATSFSELGLI